MNAAPSWSRSVAVSLRVAPSSTLGASGEITTAATSRGFGWAGSVGPSSPHAAARIDVTTASTAMLDRRYMAPRARGWQGHDLWLYRRWPAEIPTTEPIPSIEKVESKGSRASRGGGPAAVSAHAEGRGTEGGRHSAVPPTPALAAPRNVKAQPGGAPTRSPPAAPPPARSGYAHPRRGRVVSGL